MTLYDDDEFFDGYATLPRSTDGLDAAPEWPWLRAQVGEVRAKRVLDLGCGYGWFVRWAADAGAADVHGVDASQRMLDRAAQFPTPSNVRYERADLDTVELPAKAYDVVFSSLTLHYLAEIEPLAAKVRSALADGGRFVCSVEHPVFSAPTHQGFVEVDGRNVWPLDGYSKRGPRVRRWFTDGVVRHHRTVADYVNALAAHRLVLVAMEEWSPSTADLDAHPEWAGEVERPAFLLLSARAV